MHQQHILRTLSNEEKLNIKLECTTECETREQSYGKCPGKLEAEGTSSVKPKIP